MLPEAIASKLKATPEQRAVVGPLVAYLVEIGWDLGQIVFGRAEWRVPKTPSEATKRERGHHFEGFPVDIAVFDHPTTVGDHRHLLFVIECKQPTDTAGLQQLECYFSAEPHVRAGVWSNDPTRSSRCVFVFRANDGRLIVTRQRVSDLPRPGEAIRPEAQRLTFDDLVPPSELTLRNTVDDLLDKIVVGDPQVTRREDQLDQLCDLLLLKLESDKQGKADRKAPVFFRPMESAARTAAVIRERYAHFVDLYPSVFLTDKDKSLLLSDETIAACVDELATLQLIDLGVSTISLAFQVLRGAALTQGEGQYFTPQAVIQAGIRLLKLQFEDIILDPACGTGGFLVEAVNEVRRTHRTMPAEDLSRWAQTHLFGIEKDAIGAKLTKAIMQIAGDGSAHCVRGDSIRSDRWLREYPSLTAPDFRMGRFSVVVTNPPFGKNLKVKAEDSRLAHLEIARKATNNYSDLEIGIVFLERAYHWLRMGGRLGIVLPETYFFSSDYSFLFEWLEPRFQPLVVANVPMEAFQGFCRAKTNFYVFEKIG